MSDTLTIGSPPVKIREKTYKIQIIAYLAHMLPYVATRARTIFSPSAYPETVRKESKSLNEFQIDVGWLTIFTTAFTMVLPGRAHATAVNYVTNGSFTNGFVIDVATESIRQKVYVTPGVYKIEFDPSATACGSKNKHHLPLTANIWRATITSGDIIQYGAACLRDSPPAC